MKIKEVIEKTGLTDRAVRLYIDNGLVVPNIEESYSGRKSIDFTDADVERLKNIALLRKAGFSITDIKEILNSEEQAQKVVDNFIRQTENNIKHETEIINKLKSIPPDTKITLETICASLLSAVSEKEVPKEDLHLSLWEKIEKNTYKAVGIIGLFLFAAVNILTVIYWITSYKHLTLNDDWFSDAVFLTNGGWTILAILSVILLLLNRNNSFRRKLKWQRFISGFLTIIMLFVSYFAFAGSVLFSLSPPAYSQTTEIEDYLVLDSWIERSYGDEIRELFPEKIPESALKSSDTYYNEGHPYTTRYYYMHTYDLDQHVDIVAEWVLHLNEFEDAKSTAIANGKLTETKGDWICIYYSEKPDNYYSEDVYMFAYNENFRKVRYIASIRVGGSKEPYYFTLDW